MFHGYYMFACEGAQRQCMAWVLFKPVPCAVSVRVVFYIFRSVDGHICWTVYSVPYRVYFRIGAEPVSQ